MKTMHPSASSLRRRAAARRKWLGLAVVCFATVCSLKLSANPAGMTVGLGAATSQTSGAQLNVTVSQAAFLNWSSFNIQAGETTTFIQPSANSVVLNEIGGANPSQIFGNLNANGTVILANANGFYFGPNSMVRVGGDFIATTAPLTPDFGSGSSWTFTGMPPLASIINYGSIQAGNGRSLFLIAENIQNNGSLNAPGGNIGLAAGQTVLVSERPDGRGLSASVQVPAGAVNNLGQITADAGTIALQAEVVNQNGIIQANSVQNQNGVIELVASDSLTLGANSQIFANGDNSASGSAGGSVTLQSGNNFSDTAGSQIAATGGAQGGNGGSVEISAPNFLSLNSSLDAHAQAGSAAGELLLNSQDITLTSSGVNGMSGGTLDLNVNGTFANFSQIVLQASGDVAAGSGNITLAAGNVWNLGAGSGQLTLAAGGDITFGNGSKITDANKWSATVEAGYNFASDTVQSGVGNIYLNGSSGAIQLSQSSINLTAGNGIVVGSGSQLIDDGGFIGLYAPTINQNGLIQANSVGAQHGIIELVASSSLALGANSQIFANGDNSSSSSAGGQIMLQTAQAFSDGSGSQIQFRGGVNGGNGGKVLIYAAQSAVNSQLDGSAKAGSTGGSKFYYPRVDHLTLTASSLAPFAGFSRILFQANDDITIAAGATLNLSGTAGSRTTGQLTLEAGDSLSTDGNIIFGAGSKITDANDWSVNFLAGYDFVNHVVQSGVGNIFLNNNSGNYTGGGSIQTGTGNINLTAGQSVLVGGGFIRSIAGGMIGGNINVTALAGDISVGSLASGTQNSGYQFSFDHAGYPNGYRVSVDSGNNINLGGISTAAGGNVTLIAGHDINPVVGQAIPAISGAFGDQPGNVTLIAGNQVFGNFNVANGTGTILAGLTVANGSVTQTLNPGANVGSDDNPLTLSLIAGSWNVWAANNIYINEVRNPNGSFNDQKVTVPAGTYSGNQDGTGAPVKSAFLYDYAPDAAANFWAGNAIELVGSSMLRSGGYPSAISEPIYAPILTLNAGAGGITIDKSIILCPSSEGSLQITTRDGGNLVGLVQSTTLTGIIMSDSGLPQPDTFEQGRSINPVHPDPVLLNISGNIESFGLNIPTYAQINVVGDTYNFGFIGQNLHAGDVTSINVGQAAKENMEHSGILNPATDSNLRVGGAITYRGDLTQDPLSTSDPISASLFESIIDGDPALAGILRYTPPTYNTDGTLKTAGILTYVGQMGDNEINYLLNPTDANGQALIPAAQLANWHTDIQQLHDDSQSATLGDQGLAVAGPGYFNVTANNIFLGISGGISVLAPDSALAAISPYGATLNITTVGNLDMTSTRIANYGLLGDINLMVGGTLDVGGQFTTFGSPTEAKGIFTTSGGDISVTASGNVNVDSSRIAAYNGGNVTVESLNGDVNAGTGGSGYVDVSSLALDPSGNLITLPQSRIPGSGILATTISGSHAALGNILVETPNGNISASKGGVVQIAFNDADNAHATVELLAGYELQDANGNRVSAANLAEGTAVRISDNRNIEATGSGVIAQNLILKATGLLSGLFVNFAPTPPIVVASGWGPGPTVFVGPAPPSISGIPSDSTGPDPIIISDSGSSAPPPAEAAKTDAPIADTAATVTTKTENQDDGLGDDENKKKGNGIALTQKTGRVTVILPPKNSAKSQTPDPGT